MKSTETLLLTRQEVASLLSIEECIAAVENAFKQHAEGKMPPPEILGIRVQEGGFHIKAGIMNLGKTYFVAKANANFPNNMKQFGLPSIQGVIIVCDGEDGQLLALMDAIEITIIRTGAATAVAAKHLARTHATTATICGCGNQGRISLKAIMNVRQLKTVFAFDVDEAQATKFAIEMSKELQISVAPVQDLGRAVRQSDICVTCTPSRKPFLRSEDVAPGTFIAAVGADSEEKQELDAALVASSKVVVDLLSQCANIGELHHALQQGLMTREDVHAELGEVICGKKQGRTSNEEIIIFDSTGTALQDVAAAVIVYEKAVIQGIGKKFNFA